MILPVQHCAVLKRQVAIFERARQDVQTEMKQLQNLSGAQVSFWTEFLETEATHLQEDDIKRLEQENEALQDQVREQQSLMDGRMRLQEREQNKCTLDQLRNELKLAMRDHHHRSPTPVDDYHRHHAWRDSWNGEMDRRAFKRSRR